MVDRKSRRLAAELLRQLGAGRITNDEFEMRYPRASQDLAVRQVLHEGAWFLYDDLHEHRLTGRWRLSPIHREHVARWVLFLENAFEYEWPVIPAAFRIALVPFNVVTFGYVGRVLHRYMSRGGVADVWPFRRRADYEAALKEPPYLSGSM